MLFRASFLLLPILAIACSGNGADGFVLYKPAPVEVEGRLRSGTLLVTSAGRALFVEHSAAGQVSMGEGPVTPETWAGLVLSLGESGGGDDGGDPAFQVYARLGDRVIDLAAGEEDPLADLGERLEAIRAGLAPPEDPVEAAEAFLMDGAAHVRGHAVIALLMLFRDQEKTEGVRGRAREALRDQLLFESGTGGDEEIAARIREALKRSKLRGK